MYLILFFVRENKNCIHKKTKKLNTLNNRIKNIKYQNVCFCEEKQKKFVQKQKVMF